MAANRPIVDALTNFAQKRRETNRQVALAWLLARKPFVVPIPGTRDSAHLNENLGALGVSLTLSDLAELEATLAGLTVHGGRMNAEQMKVVDAST
jgi:aryl-alcohol dehydrogenase-like predicted oxidoreductase